jgi:uncharacterized repeat protein (TIGR01451 family)
VITSWSTEAGVNTGPLRLELSRPADTPARWTVVGESSDQPLTANSLNTFATRIAVKGGDHLGLYDVGFAQCAALGTGNAQDAAWAHGGAVPNGGTATFFQSAQTLLNVSAVLEPDADGDGYGDESQDSCAPDPAIHDGPCTAVVPDSTRTLAFARCEVTDCTRAAIWSQRADGASPRELTGGGRLLDVDPAYSPDGTRIAFSSCGTSCAIWLMDADGSHQRQLTSGNDRYPSWSPDGTEIVYVHGTASSNGIWAMNADGSGRHELVANTDAEGGGAHFSPDGARITYAQKEGAGQHVYMAFANGSSPSGVTTGAVTDRSPVWEPDGGKVVFDRDGKGLWHGDGIVGETQLTAGDDRVPVFAPDGNRLAFERHTGSAAAVWTAGNDGATPIQATSGRDVGASWQPIAHADLSVDDVSSAATATQGDELTYTFHVHNAGPQRAVGVVTRHDLPAGLGVISLSASQGTCSVGSGASCQLGTIESGADAVVTMVALAGRVGNLRNDVAVSSAFGDPVAANDSAAAVTTVAAAAGPAPGPTNPVAKFAGARLRSLTATVHGRVASFKVSCAVACAGKLTLAANAGKGGRRVKIGSAAIELPAGPARTVKVTLSRAAMRVLRKQRKLAASATTVAHDASGAKRTRTAAVSLKLPARSR